MATWWSDVSVTFRETGTGSVSTVQGLVQSVSVKADSGLDFTNLGSYGQSIDVKAGDITIEITWLSDGEFVNPTGCQFHDDLGLITIHRNLGVNVHNIEFKECVLIGTRSEIDAANTFATATQVYKASYYRDFFSAPNTFPNLRQLDIME